MAEKALNVQSLLDWLDALKGATTPESLIGGLCQEMLAHDIAVARVAVFARTLHRLRSLGRLTDPGRGARCASGNRAPSAA